MNFRERLLLSRKEKRLSQQVLAELIGVSRSALAQWETGVSSPSLKNLNKISKILEVSFEWLATGNGDQHAKIPEKDIINDQDLNREINYYISMLTIRKKRAMLELLQSIQ